MRLNQRKSKLVTAIALAIALFATMINPIIGAATAQPEYQSMLTPLSEVDTSTVKIATQEASPEYVALLTTPSELKEFPVLALSIDRYLAGSPLAGKGSVMVAAGKQYGIDPRAIAAISCIESGKGTNSFRPHNAWGMMGRSFSSWDEGIYANAKLLRRLGGTINMSLASKYCPPTASHWLGKVRAQMSQM